MNAVSIYIAFMPAFIRAIELKSSPFVLLKSISRALEEKHELHRALSVSENLCDQEILSFALFLVDAC